MLQYKTVGLASDHAGFPLKQFVKQYLEERHIPYKDYGTQSAESCDYPDFAHALASGIESGEVFPGIGICGTGEGVAMTMNKHQKIRAALCWNPEIAHMARLHNMRMPSLCQDGSLTVRWLEKFWMSSLLLTLKEGAISGE